jgi:adenylate cyclase
MTTSMPHLPDRNPSDVIDVVALCEVEVLSTTAKAVTGEVMVNTPSKFNRGESEQLASDVASPRSTPNGNAGGAAGSALVTSRGNFSAYLAPLNQDNFKRVVDDVHQKLQVMHDTLCMLDNLLDAQGFDAILHEMLRSITLKTGELLNADRTTIYLLDEDKNELWSIVAKDASGNNLELRFPASVGIAGEAATHRQPVNIPYDFYNDPRSEAARKFDEKNHYRTYTMLALPLLSEEGSLVAVVQLINKLKLDQAADARLADKIDPNGFTDADLQTFAEFAPSIRLIIESSRSFYKATQQQRAASALMNAVKSLSRSSLDLEKTLAQVMDEAKKLMQADRSTLWLVDRERNQLWTKIPIAGELKELRIPLSTGSFAGQVAITGEPLIIPFDLYNHPGSETSKETDKKTGYRTCSMLCMPVFNADGDLIGVTQLINKIRQGDYPEYDPATYPEAPDCWKASFNRNDQEFMQAFNIQAGVALQNAKLFETVKQQEQLQRDILRSLTNGVISTDKEGRIIAANESAKELLGLRAQEALEGLPVNTLIKIRQGDFSRWVNAALAAQEEKSRQQYYPDQTLESSGSKHEEHSINLSINTIADANDSKRVSGVLVVMEDISDEKRLKSTMYRYMTQELAERLLENPDAAKMGGDRKEVTVLFSDIRSYTTITESLTAEEVVEMLNKYFESMVDAVFQHKGTLDKYIGDAIMAVFGSPLPLEDHAWMAVLTAVDMRHRLEIFNADRVANGQQAIQIGIGINSDTVISGNIGSSKRMEFTAIGDGVNLGSRLESATKQYGTDIVISEYTYQRCLERGHQNDFYVRELDKIKVKGRSKPVSIYEVVGLSSEPLSNDRRRIIDLYHQGLIYYRDRKFRKAMNEFATIIEEIDSHDKSSVTHMERCQYWMQNPPPDDWDQVWTMTEK